MILEQLKFGTSGLRGPVAAFRLDDCYAYAISFANLLKQQFPECKKVSIAGDLRASTPMISKLFIEALEAENFEIENLGLLPTPILAFWASQKHNAAIMVTGSHIPADQNGVKFYTPDGEITKDDEFFINQQYQELKAKKESPQSQNAISGQSSILQKEAEDLFLQRYRSFFGQSCLSGLKIAFYQHSGVGREILPQILKALGAEVQIFGWASEFTPVDTENLENVSNLQAELNSRNADILLSTDGDADRPLVIDSKFGLVRGDILGIITSQLLNIKRIATPVSSTSLIEQVKYFDQVERTKIGSPFVIEGLETLLTRSATPCAGFEANGGYLLATEIRNESGSVLEALMTRDCMLPMVAYAVSRVQNRLDLLFRSFGEKTNVSGLVPKFPRKVAYELIELLQKKPNEFLKRDSVLLDQFENPKKIDLLDGVKLLSHRMESLHFRPSGNAPEFRVYIEANSSVAANDYLERSLSICRTFLSGKE